MLTKDERQAIRARVEAATPGPWDWVFFDFGEHGRDHLGGEGATVVLDFWARYADDSGWDVSDDDAAFIAAARTDVPALLDTCDALEALLLRARGAPIVCPGCGLGHTDGHASSCACDHCALMKELDAALGKEG